jgi:signal transduction histidine kinase
MRGDREQGVIDEDLASALYAADPASFLAHAGAIALLSAASLTGLEGGRGLIVCIALYSMANCLAISVWAWRRHRPLAFDARQWILLHAFVNVALFSAPGASVWIAFQSGSADLAAAHTVLLVTLAGLAYIANGLNRANVSGAVVTLLLPAIVLYVSRPEQGRFGIGIMLALYCFAIHLFASQYRGLFRGLVEARVDQERLAETITHQKRVIEEASLAKTRFFAAASHDLRQPLHAIGLLAQALTDRGANAGERDETTQHIIANVEALNHLFNQVLDLARIESGVTQVMPQHFHLSELLTRIEQRFRPAAAAKGLALRVAPTACVAFTDPVLLERVLGNLVSNAVRYTDSGSIWIGVRQGIDHERCQIEVRDSGIGIAPHEHELIFEEFYQVPVAHHTMRQGHGLGLPTVRRLVRLLGEDLSLRSDVGRGTTWRVPVRIGDASLVVMSLIAPVSMNTLAEGCRVLCIDDDAVSLDALTRLLARWGCIVRGCRDELGAVRAISEGFVPDALFCDYRIGPRQTGVKAWHEVREALRRRGHDKLACVMITGDTASPELALLAAEGVPVLHKPVTPTRLRRTLDTLVLRMGHDEAA